MNEDEFFAANDFLNYTISNRYKDQQSGISKKKEELDDFYIFYAGFSILSER